MMKRFAALAAAAVFAPALASAQPYQPVPMPISAPQDTAPQNAPPQNASWQDLSHINGQLVPVGDKNEYFIAPLRKTNISVNPVGALFGFYGASASYAISNNVAIRGDFELFDNSELKGTEMNLTFPIYLRKTYTGLFVEPGVMVRSLEEQTYDDCYDCYSTSMSTTTKTSYGPEVMIGYHYMTDSGFNMAAAFGVMRNLNKANTDEYSSDDIDVQPAGYFRVGYAF